MGLKEDFLLGREIQREHVQKENEKQKTRQKKNPPNRLLVGAGVAYESLQIEKVVSTFKEILNPIILIICDDLRWLWRKVLRKEMPDDEQCYHRYRVKEQLSLIGKRLKR